MCVPLCPVLPRTVEVIPKAAFPGHFPALLQLPFQPLDAFHPFLTAPSSTLQGCCARGTGCMAAWLLQAASILCFITGSL